MESIAELDINLPWVVPVEATESLAVVEIHPAVGHIQGIQRRGKALTEVFANREIERGVLRQVVPRIWLPRKGIAEASAVVDIGGSKRTPRQSDVAAKIESVSLIVIEREEVARGRKIRQAARDGQLAFRDLIGVRKVDLSAVSDAGRTERQFPAADFGSINGDGQT